MKFISWNIDGAKAILRKCDFMDTLWIWQADIFAFQETKLSVPDMRIKFPGYYDYWSFYENCPTPALQSGVCCFSKRRAKNVITDFEDDNFDTEGRLIILEYNHFFFVNVYVPNSQDAVSRKNEEKSVERREYREKFDKLLREQIIALDKEKPVIICGDFNASISKIDMSANSSWQEDIAGFIKEENDRLKIITKSGFTDTFRHLHLKEKRAYTHWSIREKNKETSPGRRLDYFFVSDVLKDKIKKAEIYKDTNGSDHVPIYLDIDMSRPVLRHERTVGITYDDLLERERTQVYYDSLKDVDLSSVWPTVDWNRAKKHLQEMQRSLAISAIHNDPDKIKHFQYKIVRSLDAKLLSVKSVSEREASAGIDHIVWRTDDEKVHAALSLTSKNYTAQPARLVKKLNGGKVRNIHIDTYYDRAMQALYGYSLAPVAESWSDRKSFSNRRYRSTLDANYYICKIFSGKDAPKWAYITDVTKCYESIDHDWIRGHIPMASHVLDEFLRAGYFFSDRYYDMYMGVGIGCRLSVYLANMALNGLQEYIYDRLYPGNDGYNIDYDNGNMIRYADDIIVSARDEETAFQIGRIVTDFMRGRGLMLSSKKTDIIYVPDGFDFLKRSYKLYGDNLIASPSNEAIINFKNKISAFILTFKGSQERLIDELNSKIVGFVTYHKMTDCGDVFRELDYYVRLCLFKFCTNRCPTWHRDRIIKEYWFVDEKNRPTYALKNKVQKQVIFMEDAVPTRYKPIPLYLNAYKDYDKINDITDNRDIENVIGKYRIIWDRQAGRCACCEEKIFPDDDKELIELYPTEKRFTDRMAYIHSRCRNITYEYEDDEYELDDPTNELLVELSDEGIVDDIEKNPLYKYFKESKETTITLSFKRIEELSNTSLSELAYLREFWLDDSDNKLCRTWLDNGFVVKRIRTSGRRQVTFHKYRFTGETAKVYIPDLLLHGEVPMRMKLRIEAMLKHEFERNGLLWE